MMPSDTHGRISIIGVLILGVVLLLVLNYFHISIQVVVGSPTPQGQSAENLWADYLQKPAETIWNEFLLPYFWNPFLDALKSLKAGNWNVGPVGQPMMPMAPATTSQ